MPGSVLACSWPTGRLLFLYTKATCVGAISPAEPQGLQRLAHGAVGMCGLRLDARADDITDEAVHRRRDPGVVAGIPSCASGCRGRTGQDRHVQAVDRARAVPAAATACCVKGSVRRVLGNMGPRSFWKRVRIRPIVPCGGISDYSERLGMSVETRYEKFSVVK